MFSTLHDALPTFLDANGKPVIGKLTFYEADGTTYKPIYSDQNYTTELSNPLLTNYSGQPNVQPFLKNGIYRIRIDKFIGDNLADMNDYLYEEENPNHLGTVSHWEFVKEFVIDSGIVDESGAAALDFYTVQTIDELRQLNYLDHPYATVVDYDATVKGIAPRSYIWQPSSSRPEDYGATIISSLSNSGRWELLESSTIDSTTFGISPYVDQGTLQSRLNGLSAYSMAGYHKAQVIYLQGGTYRLQDGANLSLGIPVVCHSYLKFLTPNGHGRVSFQGGLDYLALNNLNDENTTLIFNQEKVHAAWFAGTDLSFNGQNVQFKTIVADSTNSPRQYYSNLNVEINRADQEIHAENCSIRLDVNVNAGGSFEDCRFKPGVGSFIVSTQSFSGNTVIYPWMWAGNFDPYSLTLGPDVGYSITDWDAQLFADLKVVQGNHNIGSLNNGSIDITMLDNSSAEPYTIENGSGYIDCHSFTVGLKLINFNGTIANFNSNSSLDIINSSISLTLANNCTIAAMGSNLTLDAQNPECIMALRDSFITGVSGVQYAFSSFAAQDSIVGIDLYARNSSVRGSELQGEYSLKPEPGTYRAVEYLGQTVIVSHFIHGYFDNNLWRGKFKIDGASASVDYNASHVLVDHLRFQNNRSELTSLNAWEITRLGAMNRDSLNDYTFINNTGGFECYLEMKDVPVEIGVSIILSNGTIGSPLSLEQYSTYGCWQMATNINSSGDANYADDYSKYFTKMRMFVIGQHDASVNLELTILPGEASSGTVYHLQPNSMQGFTNNTLYGFDSPSRTQMTLTTESKYDNSTLDNAHPFVIPDLGKQPNTTTEEWQIRNFVLGHTNYHLSTSGRTYQVNISFRQLDKVR